MPGNLLHAVQLSALCLLLALASGCGSTGAHLTLDSHTADAALSPHFTAAVYAPIDRNTADIYLSDLPLERLTNQRDDLAGVEGNVVHIHVFLMPVAGLTPIEKTACNITLRHIVLAGPARQAGAPEGALGLVLGMYGGGGFFFPSTDCGSEVLRGTIRDATLRLARATPGFVDRLGIAGMTGSLAAERDERAARLMAVRFENLLRRTAPTTPAP